MCGRATLTASPEDLRELFGLTETPMLGPRYNIAPTQPIAVIREAHRGRIELIRWGLLSAPHGGINARVETVSRAPVYRESFRKRRCLVIVDGYYEWLRRETGGQARSGRPHVMRQPFLVRREDTKPVALAGIWEASAPTGDGEVVEACAIITGPARGVAADVHNRMPLVVPAAEYERWLNSNVRDIGDVLAGEGMEAFIAYPVSMAVNTPANDDPRCLEQVTDLAELPGAQLRLV